MSSIVISDLVPLRERPIYNSFIGLWVPCTSHVIDGLSTHARNKDVGHRSRYWAGCRRFSRGERPVEVAIL